MAITKTVNKTVKIPKETKELEYVLTINLADQVLKGKGATALEALKSIKKPIKIFTKANIELSYGKKSCFQTWQPIKVKRLFFPLAQGIMSKQLEYLLK